MMLVKRGHSGFGMSAFFDWNVKFRILPAWYSLYIFQGIKNGARPGEGNYPHDNQLLFFLIMKLLEQKYQS
jgi:hypothetical protein